MLFRSTLAVGTRTFGAAYPGDLNALASNAAAVTHTVRATTVTTVTPAAPTTPWLETATFTVSVTSGDGTTPTGSVSVYDASTLIDTCTLGETGTCSVSTSSLTVGAHTIRAVYTGDAARAGSNGSIGTAITTAATTVTVSDQSPNPSFYGQPVTLTVTVASARAVPSGTITVSDGTQSLGSCTLSDGTCRITTSALLAGTRSLVARYPGAATFAASVSTAAVQTVAKAETRTVVTALTPTATFGQLVTFRATVDSTTATPTGYVAIYDGALQLGLCYLQSGACELQSSTLSAVGSPHQIRANYLGTNNIAVSTSATIGQVITTVASATTVTSAGPVALGSPVTVTVNVDTTTGVATGAVTVVEGSATLGTCALSAAAGYPARATCSVTVDGLTIGTHTLSASYPGDGNVLASTGSMTQAITVGLRSTSAASITGTSLAVPRSEEHV